MAGIALVVVTPAARLDGVGMLTGLGAAVATAFIEHLRPVAVPSLALIAPVTAAVLGWLVKGEGLRARNSSAPRWRSARS